MDNLLKFFSIVAGVSFGAWPLVMNKSPLPWGTSSVIFTTTILICMIPFAISNPGNLARINIWIPIIAGLISAVGIACFNGMLVKATSQNLGSLFVIMIVTQTTFPVMYDIIMKGGLGMKKGLGFILAFAACILLSI